MKHLIKFNESPLFGSTWTDDNSDDDVNIFSHWKEDSKLYSVPSEPQFKYKDKSKITLKTDINKNNVVFNSGEIGTIIDRQIEKGEKMYLLKFPDKNGQKRALYLTEKEIDGQH